MQVPVKSCAQENPSIKSYVDGQIYFTCTGTYMCVQDACLFARVYDYTSYNYLNTDLHLSLCKKILVVDKLHKGGGNILGDTYIIMWCLV